MHERDRERQSVRTTERQKDTHRHTYTEIKLGTTRLCFPFALELTMHAAASHGRKRGDHIASRQKMLHVNEVAALLNRIRVTTKIHTLTDVAASSMGTIFQIGRWV